MKRIVIGIVALFALGATIFGTMLWWKWNTAINRTKPRVALTPADLKLTLAWNGKVIDAPPPATLPQSVTESWQYRKWLWIGDKRTFVWKDADGNRGIASALGILKDRKGVRIPLISSIKILSPSGGLINSTTYTPQGYPDVWTLYNQDGSKRVKVGYGNPPSYCLKDVTFYSRDGTGREYVAGNLEQIAWAEWQLDSKGSEERLIHGGKKSLVQAFLKKQRARSSEATPTPVPPRK